MKLKRAADLNSYLQSEEAECGLMCIGAALATHGSLQSAADLRRLFPSSNRGTTLGRLCEIASSLHLAPTAVRCSTADLRQLAIPSLLHWRGDHFVLLLRTGRSHCEIFDPAAGIQRLKYSAIEELFAGGTGTGVAVQLRSTPGLQPTKRRAAYPISTLLRPLSGVKRGLLHLIALSTLIQVVNLSVPLLSQVAINFGVSRGNVSALLTVAACTAVVITFAAATEFWRHLINHRLASQVSLSVARELFAKLLALPLIWHQRRRLADVISRFDSVEPLRATVSTGLPTLIVDSALSILLATGMFWVSPLMASFIVGSVLLTVLCKGALTPLVTRASGESISLRIKEHGRRIETFKSVQTLKLAGAERDRERSWAGQFEQYLDTQDRAQSWVGLQQAAAGFFGGIGNLATILFGALLVSDGRLSVGGLFAFVMYRRFMADKAVAAFDQINGLSILRFHLLRLAEVDEAAPEFSGPANAAAGEAVNSAQVSLSGIAFRHSETDRWVLRDVRMSIEAGQFAVITGPSGSGKSTLLRLVAGLYQPTIGEMSYDGLPATQVHPSRIRAGIGAVTQEDQLLTGSVLENVTMFSDFPDHKLCEEALRAAEAWEDVKRFPLGIHTQVGEAGAALSAGQRQRVILARALYGRPTLLILDEATAHVDPETERRIYDNLKQLSSTKIVVSHQPLAQQVCDRRFVLDNQGLRELGAVVNLVGGAA